MNPPATASAATRSGRPRRRPRDWAADALLFLAALIFALLVIGGRLESSTPPPTWLFTADVIAGLLGCAGLWLRRRWPVGLALVLIAGLVYVLVRPEPGIPSWFLFLIGVAVQSAAVGWGLFIHFRRQLVLSLRDRAVRPRPTSSVTGCRC